MSKEILALALLFLTSKIFAQNLEAILSDTRLPVPAYGMPVVYDGEDSIYVMGGYGQNHSYNQKDTLKFGVTKQTLVKVGTMDLVTLGTAVWAGDDNLLYFGGSTATGYQTKVFNYKTDGSYWTRVGDLPRSAAETSSVWGQGEYSYVFGGYNGICLSTISRYSSVTNSSTVVGNLPSSRYGTSAIWDEAAGDAYIFGGMELSVLLNDIVQFNPAKKTVEKLNVTLPLQTYYSCAVWVGTEAYIIGGTNFNEEVFDIARFNPSTNQVLNVPVNNLPPNLYLHSCAFVKKLNRIYVFGGLVRGSPNARDEIMYIDLNPSSTNPTAIKTPIATTTEPGIPADCKIEVCGTRFTNPSCCESYYQCQNQEAVDRHCPSDLQFNPSNGECDFPGIFLECRAVFE